MFAVRCVPLCVLSMSRVCVPRCVYLFFAYVCGLSCVCYFINLCTYVCSHLFVHILYSMFCLFTVVSSTIQGSILQDCLGQRNTRRSSPYPILIVDLFLLISTPLTPSLAWTGLARRIVGGSAGLRGVHSSALGPGSSQFIDSPSEMPVRHLTRETNLWVEPVGIWWNCFSQTSGTTS